VNYSVLYKDFTSNRNFGRELEMGHFIPKNKVATLIKSFSDKNCVCTKYELSTNNDYWHVKDDATCGVLGRKGPKGVEVASYIASGKKDLEHIANVARMLSFSGCRTNNNCGLHIHADVKDLDLSSAGVILAYWIKIESWIENSLPKYRRTNKYCRKVSSSRNFDRLSPWKPQDLFIFFAPKNLNIYENEDRRVSFNLVNYVKSIVTSSSSRSTFELRYPEGTLEYNDIKCWTCLFLNFIETCKNKEMPKTLLNFSSLDEVLCCLGLNHTPENFFIFGDELHETRMWFLKRLIQNGGYAYKRQAQKKFLFLSDSFK